MCAARLAHRWLPPDGRLAEGQVLRGRYVDGDRHLELDVRHKGRCLEHDVQPTSPGQEQQQAGVRWAGGQGKAGALA